MAAKPKPKWKTKPLPGSLTGKNPPKSTWAKPPKGAYWLGNRPVAGGGLNAKEVQRGAVIGGEGFANQQFNALDPAFEQLTDQQYDQIQRLQGGFNNQYTRDARGQINQSFGTADRVGRIGNQTIQTGQQAGQQISNLAPVARRQANSAATNINRQGNKITQVANQYMGQIGGVGTMLANQARRGFSTSGPTEIEAELYRQGQEELAMGRALSPEQLREATQSARQGMAARGMATGQAALGAELLNRDRYATQRETERRGFAADANQLREKNVMDRRDAAGRLAEAGGQTLDAAGRIGMAGREAAGRLYDAGGRMRMLGTTTAGDLRGMGAETAMRGQSLGGSLLADAGRLRQTGAGMITDLDPFARAVDPGMRMGQTAQGMGLDTIGQSYGNMLDLNANTGSFNVNRNDSLYNTWLNNATAVQTGNMAADSQRNAANITAAAQRSAGSNNMWGNIIGGGLGGLGGIFGSK